MGCGPKKSDYKASPAEQASAAVAMAEKAYFKENYEPKNLERLKRSLSDQPIKELRGAKNADTMQALTSTPNAQSVLRGQDVGQVASALTGELGIATAAGRGMQNDEGIASLEVGRGNAAAAQSGMARSGDLATSGLLASAKAKQDVSNAKFAALGQITGAVGSRIQESRQAKRDAANSSSGGGNNRGSSGSRPKPSGSIDYSRYNA